MIHILHGSRGLARCRESARLAGAMGEPVHDFVACVQLRVGDQLGKTVPCLPELKAAIGLVTAACQCRQTGDPT